jgi:hypothetical protein
MAADTYASLSDLRVAAYMNQELLQLLHEAGDLRQTMIEVPFTPNSASAAVKLGLYQPIDAFAAPGEDTAATVTNITDASATLTVARYALQRELTDLALITGGPDLDKLAADMAMSANYTIASILTAGFTNLATSVGSSGVNLSVDDIYSGQYALQLSLVTGPFYTVLHPQQWNDFQASLRGETGAVAFVPATDEFLAIKGTNFKGTWHGIEFYTHNSVAAAGGNRIGAMYGRGAYAYTEAPVDRIVPYMNMSVSPAGSKMVVEIVRGSTGASKGKTFAVGQYYPAVAEVEDLRGVKVVTDE